LPCSWVAVAMPTSAGAWLHVEGRALVRVLAVAQVLHLDELAVEGPRELAATFCAEGLGGLVHGAHVVGDHAVVGWAVCSNALSIRSKRWA
jgi:hypothetical protein